MTTQKPNSQPECEWVENCIEICQADPIFVAENAAEVYFNNPRKATVRKIHYDGCYCRDNNVLKADYILGYEERIDVIIELKGSDLKHAYAQAESTLERWRTDPNCYPRIACLIAHCRRESELKKTRRLPGWRSEVGSAEVRFLRTTKTLLLIRESGAQRFNFNDFLRSRDVR